MTIQVMAAKETIVESVWENTFMKLSILAPEPNSENTVHEQQLIKGGFRNGKLLN